MQRQVARELGNKQYVYDLKDELIVSSYSDSPKEAWDIWLSDKRDHLAQPSSLIRIVKQLVRDHGMESLDQYCKGTD